MRRGLMGWNAEELPVATLEARLSRLRAAMAKAGMDAFVIYTNNTRPSAVPTSQASRRTGPTH